MAERPEFWGLSPSGTLPSGTLPFPLNPRLFRVNPGSATGTLGSVPVWNLGSVPVWNLCPRLELWGLSPSGTWARLELWGLSPAPSSRALFRVNPGSAIDSQGGLELSMWGIGLADSRGSRVFVDGISGLRMRVPFALNAR